MEAGPAEAAAARGVRQPLVKQGGAVKTAAFEYTVVERRFGDRGKGGRKGRGWTHRLVKLGGQTDWSNLGEGHAGRDLPLAWWDGYLLHHLPLFVHHL